MSTINEISGANRAEYIEQQAAAARSAPQSGSDFSAVIADAVKEELSRVSVMAQSGTSGTSGLGGFMPMQLQQGSGLEQMILAAASSGEVSDAQAALFMLCMMMQTSQDGDFTMIMQMMASMIAQMEDEENSLRKSVMSSRYDPYVLDSIDWGVFGNAYPGYFGAGGAVMPLEFWRPSIPVVTSNEDDRNSERYTSVIRQFRVETAERYRPFRDGNTYCNIFMWDVTSAMGAEIPHYTDYATGEPRYYPDTRGAKAMTAQDIDMWLKNFGPEYGWRQVDPETAQRHANEGKPAVTSGGTLGHVQVVCPSRNGEYDPVRGVTIAQAGSRVTSYAHITDIYGSNALRNNISYWVHD